MLRTLGSRIAAAAMSLAVAAAPACAAAEAQPTGAPTLQTTLDALARRARPGVLGATVIDLQSGAVWRVNADRAYPMMSVFKAPLAATVLARVEGGELSLAHAVSLGRDDLRAGVSGIRDEFRGERMTFTVRELLEAAVSRSDNTAADALLGQVGGPAAVTAFLRAHGIDGMRVDRGEGALARDIGGLGADGRTPPGETPAQARARRRGGVEAYLRDPRDTSTPDAAATFLRKLLRGELLAPAATRYLIDLMYAQATPRRLADGLPAGVRLAHKCGTTATIEGLTAAYNDIGVMTWPDGRSVIVAAFLAGSPASVKERDALFAELAGAVAKAVHP